MVLATKMPIMIAMNHSPLPFFVVVYRLEVVEQAIPGDVTVIGNSFYK
jgi:hypothetical protein